MWLNNIPPLLVTAPVKLSLNVAVLFPATLIFVATTAELNVVLSSISIKVKLRVVPTASENVLPEPVTFNIPSVALLPLIVPVIVDVLLPVNSIVASPVSLFKTIVEVVKE